MTQAPQNIKTLYKGNDIVYSEMQIEDILKTFKEKSENIRDPKIISPYYMKSMSTFKFLQDEQFGDETRF